MPNPDTIRVLLVEDDPGDARLVQVSLRRPGQGAFLVHHAGTLAEALRRLERHGADVVLLDLSLPDSHGLGTVERVRTAYPLVPVIVLTGLDDTDFAVNAVEAGAQDFLVKGQTDAALMQRAIRYALSRQRLEDDLRAAKTIAEAASRAKSEFLATISHEIRTPMNGVLGTLALLADGELNAEQRRLAELSRRSAEGLLRLIDDILDFSKMEAGRLVIDEAPCDPAQIAHGVIQVLRPLAEEKGLDLGARMLPSVPEAVATDPARLRQILFNLVGNAIKFTDHGHVAVRARRGAERPDGRFLLEFEVEDSGIGIAAEAKATLFERFTQADGSITRRYGGTGLGLAICRQLCEAMGGAIAVSSVPGRGSVFTVSVACTAANAAALHAAERADAAAPAVVLPPLRILAVDDNPVNRDIVRRLMQRAGHRVVTAADGTEAVRLAGEADFDVVLMDVQMPEMDGLTATRAIRALPGARGSVPVIALTAHSSGQSRGDCLAAGMNGFVAKPVRPPVLLREIATVLRASNDLGWDDAPPAPPALSTSPASPSPPPAASASGTTTGADGLLDPSQVRLVADALGSGWMETVEGFGAGARRQIDRIAAALADGDYALPAHTLKGMAWNVGARRLGDAAQAVERAPRDEAARLAGGLAPLLADTLAALAAV